MDPEAKDPRQQIPGKLLHAVIPVRDGRVKGSARSRDLGLHLAQVPLQVEELLARLELGIIFCQQHDLGDPGPQVLFMVEALRTSGLRQLDATPGLGHPFKQLPFVRGVTPDRFHELRHHVPPLLQLHVHGRKAIAQSIPSADEAVVKDPHNEEKNS